MREGKHILIVEDNAALASVLRFNFLQAGFQVAVANNGREAWQKIHEQTFDVVLTDEQMPEMTGRQLCGRLRESAEHLGTPVIMLTAKGLELDHQQLREELGIVAVFVKPFSPQEVIRAVEDCLAAAS